MPNGKGTMGRVTEAKPDRTNPERQARRRAVELGRADIRAGRYVTPEEIDRWIGTVGTPKEQPVPQSRKR